MVLALSSFIRHTFSFIHFLGITHPPCFPIPVNAVLCLTRFFLEQQIQTTSAKNADVSGNTLFSGMINRQYKAKTIKFLYSVCPFSTNNKNILLIAIFYYIRYAVTDTTTKHYVIERFSRSSWKINGIFDVYTTYRL